MNPSDPNFGFTYQDNFGLNPDPLNEMMPAGFMAADQLQGPMVGEYQNGEMQQPNQSQGSQISSLGFGGLSQVSEGTWDAFNNLILPPGPEGEQCFAMGSGSLPQMVGDDAFLGGELNINMTTPRSIIGNKCNAKMIVENSGEFGYNATQEEEVSSSQSSDVSQEAKIPSLLSYAGKYNFEVKLGQNMNKKTAVYSPAWNQLYCNSDIKILLNIKLECGKAWKDFMVKSEVVFTENTHIMEPVKRCITCLNKEAGAKGVKLTDVNEDSLFNHVIRDYHSSAIHERNKQNRYYAIAPLERPQLGSDGIISRNYEFKCLNTCFVHAKKRLSVIFSLLENNKPVGRSVMSLKVCSCPVRDYKNDKDKFEEKSAKQEKAKGGTRKRRAAERLEKVDEDEKLDLADVVEKQRCVSPPLVGNLSIKYEPGTAAARENKANDGNGQNSFSQSQHSNSDSEVDLSQGGSQETFCARTLSKIAPDIKLFYELKKSGNLEGKVLADTYFGTLKSAHKMSEKLQKAINLTPRPAHQQEGAGHGSPDSGVNAKTP